MTLSWRARSDGRRHRHGPGPLDTCRRCGSCPRSPGWPRKATFVCTVPDVVEQRIDAGLPDIRIECEVPAGPEQRARVATFPSSEQVVVVEWVHAARSDVGVVREIPACIEVRPWVATLGHAVAAVVALWRQPRGTDVRIALAVPVRLEQRVVPHIWQDRRGYAPYSKACDGSASRADESTEASPGGG